MLEQELWLRAADDIAWELRQARQEGRTIPQELQRQVQDLPSGSDCEQAAWKTVCRHCPTAGRSRPGRPGAGRSGCYPGAAPPIRPSDPLR